MKILVSIFLLVPFLSLAQVARPDSAFIAQNYRKIERMVAMRDGVKLFTSIYIPVDTTENFPFLMERTPYSCYPYGESMLPTRRLGPDKYLMYEKYIFVYQDVRGRYKSGGNFDEMTPSITLVPGKKTDESTDAFDTIDWLLANIPHNNGKVGLYGISYPGFYATACLPNAHPAIKAVSPQAPVTDEFIGDDAYHNGAFYLMDNFDFSNYFLGSRVDSGAEYKVVFENSRSSAYSFFLKLGALKNTKTNRYFGNKSRIWNEYLGHPVYDNYWQVRNIRSALMNIQPAVLVVGGWYDAEDLFGALRTFETIKKQNPKIGPGIVMGPWTHGGWNNTKWTDFAGIDFGLNVNEYYQKEVEAPFFNYYLKGKGTFQQTEATIFETGSNQWKHYPVWPPAESNMVNCFFRKNGKLSTDLPATNEGFDQYNSDPANPVPYTGVVQEQRNDQYMAEDQGFLSGRTDVLSFQSEILQEDLIVAGWPHASIFLTSSGTDADIIVKLIDVYPADSTHQKTSRRLIRAEVFRCKFRNSYEHPQPLEPGKIAHILFDLNDIDHVFLKGHRLMVQVQSSWFPLVDRNPQQFLTIPECSDADFKKATIQIFHQQPYASGISLPALGDHSVKMLK